MLSTKAEVALLELSGCVFVSLLGLLPPATAIVLSTTTQKSVHIQVPVDALKHMKYLQKP